VFATQSCGPWRVDSWRYAGTCGSRSRRRPITHGARCPSRHDAARVGHDLSAQARYAAGVREILECWFEQRPIREEYLIVDGGHLAAPGRIPNTPATPQGIRSDTLTAPAGATTTAAGSGWDHGPRWVKAGSTLSPTAVTNATGSPTGISRPRRHRARRTAPSEPGTVDVVERIAQARIVLSIVLGSRASASQCRARTSSLRAISVERCEEVAGVGVAGHES